MAFQKGLLERFFGRSKQDAEMEARNEQEEVDATEPPTDLASTHETLIVSPTFAQDIIIDLPDRSAEEATSIVNHLALNDVSNPSPEHAVPAKRKRDGTDVVDGSPEKRAAKGSGTNGTRNEPLTKTTNGITWHGGSTSRASSEVANEAPGKLSKRKRPLKQNHPAVQESGVNWEPSPSPTSQVEKTASPTTKPRTPSNPQATRRPRGRPPLEGPSPTKKITSTRKGQRRKTPNPKGKPGMSPKVTSNKGQGDVVGVSETGPRDQDEVGSEEHEEDEDERKTEGRRPEEAIDRDGQTSVQMDEGEGGAEAEEQDSDFEDHTQVDQTDEEEVEGEEELELFGQEGAWKTVLEGARSVCGSKLPLNHMPKLLTKTVKSLVNEVRGARHLYEQLLQSRVVDHDSVNGLNYQIRESLDAIEDQIRSLSEKTAGTKGSQMITDIFARAIPAMVFLLQSALASRVYHSDEPCDLKALNGIVRGLEEILRLQKLTILLCTTASTWQAKPAATTRPIIKPTTQKIFPYVKVMQEAFARRLSEQQRRRKVKQNEVDTRNRQNQLLHLSQQAQQEAARKNEILHRRIRESREQEEEKRRNMKQTYRQFKEDDLHVERQVNGHVESNTLWSDAEDLELYFQLEKGYVGGLTSTFMRSHPLCHWYSLINHADMERYSNILNTRLLQNKLPEHIRERALYFKPTLLEERGALEWISSIE